MQCPLGFVGDGIICLPDTDLDGIRDEVVRVNVVALYIAFKYMYYSVCTG